MIKMERLQVSGLTNALYGMRIPKNSNYLSDSYCTVYDKELREIQKCVHINDLKNTDIIIDVFIGEKDKKLAKNLVLAGTDHGKWLRQVQLSFLLTAPMTAWWDIDTYKVATIKNSTSRMHTITNRHLTCRDFSYDDNKGFPQYFRYRRDIVKHLNNLIDIYNDTTNTEEKEEIFRMIIQDLPQSFNFAALYTCSAQTARSFYLARKNHKQKELRELADKFANIPIMGEFITA